MPRAVSRSIVLATVVGIAVGGVVATAHAQAVSSTLGSGGRLGPGQSIVSPAGLYTLTMQTDGNLVERTTKRSGSVWNTNTANHAGSALTMQTDGNLVLRTPAGAALWTSSTTGNPGATLRIQDDGNIVIAARTGRAVWTTGVDNPPPPEQSGTLRPGQSWTDQDGFHFSASGEFETLLYDGSFSIQQELHPGGRTAGYGTPTWFAPGTVTGGGSTRLTLQTDGNVVLYVRGLASWTTHTAGRNATAFTIQDDGNIVLRNSAGGTVWTAGSGRKMLDAGMSLAPGQQLRQVDPRTFAVIAALTMQTDGNLVFSRNGRAVWSSGTNAPGSRLVMQSDGNTVVVGPDGRARWSTGTAGSGTGNVLFLDYYSPLRLIATASDRTLWSVG